MLFTQTEIEKNASERVTIKYVRVFIAKSLLNEVEVFMIKNNITSHTKKNIFRYSDVFLFTRIIQPYFL